MQMLLRWFRVLGLAAGFITQSALAATVEFEPAGGLFLVEGAVVSNQFAAHYGVTFSALFTNTIPEVARRGEPNTAYTTSTLGGDAIDPADPRNAEVGDYFLTPGGSDWPRGIKLSFAAPVSNLTFLLIDLDFRETFVVRAYVDDVTTNHVIRQEYNADSRDGPVPPDGGDARTTFVQITATNSGQLFTRVEMVSRQGPINAGGPMAFDRFSFDYTPPPADPPQLALSWSNSVPGLTLTGSAGRPYRIDYADTLAGFPTNVDWHPWSNLFLPGPSAFQMDLSASNLLKRFYRAVGLE